jgi:telomere length regulation protein
LDKLPQLEQRKALFSVLKLLSEDYLNRLGLCESDSDKLVISAAAGAINSIVGTDGNRKGHLVEWLTKSSGAGLGDGVAIRRAVLAVISQDREKTISVLEQSLAQFGDQLYIKYSPILQQEGQSVPM